MAVGASAASVAGAAIIGDNTASTLAGGFSNSLQTGASLDVSPESGVDTTPFANATADSPLAGFPTAGGTFTILTTGDSSLADDGNGSSSSGESLSYNPPSRGDANDPTTLGVSFNTPAGTNCLNIDYRFFSEEFPEFVGTSFNDRFIAELDQTTWTASGQESSAPLDFAARGTQISINSIGPTAVSPENAAGTTYDAASALVTTKTVVSPGAHTLFLSIFDASDHIYDSAVFVDNLRFTDTPPIQCRPPDIFGGKVGVDPANTAQVKNGKAIIPIECNLPPAATINCIGTISLTAAGGQLNRVATISKQKKIGKKKKYSIKPGATKKVKVKLTGKAKKAVKRKGKLKAKAKIRNTENGAKRTFKLKLKG
jgi:hypothetical protein